MCRNAFSRQLTTRPVSRLSRPAMQHVISKAYREVSHPGCLAVSLLFVEGKWLLTSTHGSLNL
jgi:hypothetical protein